MSLTAEQLTTLAAAIRADTTPAVVAALAIRNDVELAVQYNLASAIWVWRSTVPVEEYRNALTWTEVDALTAGKARIWEWVTGLMTLPLEAGKAAIRQGLADCWAVNTTTRTSLIAVGKRRATKAEALFVAGAAAGTEAAPKDLGFEGQLSHPDISKALNDNPVG